MIVRFAIGVAAIATLAGARLGTAQDNAGIAMRGPRFLVASAEGLTPVDVRRAPVLSHRLSLNLVGVTRKQALAEIARRSGAKLVYNDDILGLDGRVQLRADNLTVAAALTDVLWDAGIDLVLSGNGQIALVRRRRGAVMSRSGAVLGRVTDVKTGRSLASTEVWLEGTQRRTLSDSAGWYRLSGVDTGAYTLTARRLGYSKQSHKIVVQEGGEDTVHVALAPLAVALDELVTTATGQQRRRDIGNSITTIRADSVLQSAPIRNLTDLLENRVPGLAVQHTSGAPGDPARLRLRGLGSVMRSNDPVTIVDGVRVYATQANARSGNLTNAGLGTAFGSRGRTATELPAPSPLDQIDPNTIEKVEVFKGPSAATLYGADAANGVIVITTKKGRAGPTQWNASFTHGNTASPGRYPEGYYRFGHIPELGDVTVFCPLVEVRCVQDSLVRFQALNDPTLSMLGKGHRNAFSLTVSGGSQALTYSVTGSYSDEVGLMQLPGFEAERFRERFNRNAPDWMQKPHRLENWSVKSSVTALIGRSADVTLSTMLSRSEQQRSSLENQLKRLAGAYVDRINGYYYMPRALRGTTAGGLNFLLTRDNELLNEYYTRSSASSINFTTGLNGNWRPKSWLNITSQAGLNVIPRDDQLLQAAGLVAPSDSGAFIRGTGRSLVSTFNIQSAIRKPLPMGLAFETSVGVNLTTQHTGDLVGSAIGLVPGTTTLAGARTISAIERREDLSVFGWYIEPRITGQRFALSTGIRLDGGSAYGTRVTSMLGLPKLNGSWIISEERWFPFQSLFSSFRLRGAYGQAQVQPGVTDRLRIYRQPTNEGAGRLDLSSVGNASLRPERSVEIEGGFDADLLDARVTLKLTGYQKTQIDALMRTELPGSVNGGGPVITNIGNIRNKGIEATLGLTPVRSAPLTWTMNLNYARNVNTLVKLGSGVSSDPRRGLVEGYPVNSRWARPIVGFADANGDGILERGEIQIGDNFIYMGRLNPASEMSAHSNMALFGGALTFSAGFSFEGGATQVDKTAETNWVLARGLTDPTVPLMEQAAVLALDSTEYGLTQRVSTFRFNSLSVNYRVPDQVARLLRASRMTVAIQGSNLAMHSSYRGKDPDVMAWGAGENIVDTGQLPQPRTWQLALFLQY